MNTEKLQKLESALTDLTPTDFVRLNDGELSRLEKLLASLSEQTEAQRLYRGVTSGDHRG